MITVIGHSQAKYLSQYLCPDYLVLSYWGYRIPQFLKEGVIFDALPNSRDLLKLIRTQGTSYGFGDAETRAQNSSKTVVVEYSSPNIAKPFHVGHLRSTITGNIIANLYEKLGWKVVRLNYLGDWGTQFGLLLVGYNKFGSEENLNNNALQHLYQVYVQINKEEEQAQKSSSTTTTHQQGMEAFYKLENGDPENLQLWKRFRDISLNEYSELYKRLGVSFTEHHSESMYNTQSLELMKRLKDEGLVKADENGTEYIEVGDEEVKKVIVRKSDGTSLYLTRDIAALIDRFDKYKFDRIHYVAGGSQEEHFQNLCGILSQLPDWKERLNPDLHIKFGNIIGMKTRHGSVVFLKDVLEEAKERMRAGMLKTKTTKVHENLDEVADILGCSAVIVQNVATKRERHYNFSWERVLNFKQDSGVFLQYCHSRLCGIERNCGLDIDIHMTDLGSHLNKLAAENLFIHLERFEEVVMQAFQKLEPFYITRYLFELCHLVNAAYLKCPVRNTDPVQGQAHLQMFNASRTTLANGMMLLGLQPLEKM